MDCGRERILMTDMGDISLMTEKKGTAHVKNWCFNDSCFRRLRLLP